MSITQIEISHNHLFHKCKEICIHKNDVSHLTFNMIIKKGFGENNEGIMQEIIHNRNNLLFDYKNTNSF